MDHKLADMPLRLSREEFHAWTAAQPRGRYERLDGEVIQMAAERAVHLRVKARVWQALDRAIRVAGLPCEAFPDGATVEIEGDTDFEPDATVNCGERMADDAIATPNPVVVVEVSSPSTRSIDTGTKLIGYFRVPSIQHYLIVRANRRSAIHHQRRSDGGIETRLIAGGEVRFDPPGLMVLLDDFYAD